MGKYDLSAEAAATDAEFAPIIAKLGMLTEAQIIELLPKKTDQIALQTLIAEVNAATDDNSKKAALLANVATATDAVKKVLLQIS
jgi:hypothetical protein